MGRSQSQKIELFPGGVTRRQAIAGLSAAAVAACVPAAAFAGTTPTAPAPANETVIVLSDDGITVNDDPIAEEPGGKVYAAHDVVYYEDRDSYDSGNPYGEGEADERAINLAKAANAPLYIVHLANKQGVEAVTKAKDEGYEIYAETCPQYLTLDETRYLEEGDDGFAGAKYVMSPPLRKPSDVRALRAAVLAGEVDSIATDHCSFNLHGQKDRGRGDFTRIPNGGPGIEHRPAVMATAFEGRLGPVELARLMSEGPARVFGMWPRKGRLAPGADADVCVWDPRARWTISAATQQQAVDYTPYEGMEAHGRAHLVYVGGVLAARDGAPTGARPGTYVSR